MGGAARWARLLAAAGYACRRPLLRRRVGKLALERVDGVPILVLPEVFNPSLFRTGAWLARAVPRPAEGAPAAPLPGAPRALDMGTGSGIGAVFAARLGYQVTAVDVNPQAVRCVRLNAMIHGLEERITARQGDLFAAVAGERFDLVLFNPPFFRGAPRSALDAAWRGDGVIERFAAGLPAMLAPGGRALLLVSSAGGADRVLADHAAPAGLRLAPVARRGFAGEVISILEATPVQAPPLEATPVQTQSVEATPVQAPPVEAPPVQTPPVQMPPVEAIPVQAAERAAAPGLRQPPPSGIAQAGRA